MVSAELTAESAQASSVEISANMPKERQSWLAKTSGQSRRHHSMDSPLALICNLVKFQPEDREHLRDPEHRPVDHPRLHWLAAQDAGAIFEEIRRATSSSSTIPIRISTPPSCAS